MKNATNYNPDTGVRYGYISANSLDPDLVHELMYGMGAKDLSYAEFLANLEDRLNLDTDEGQSLYDEEIEDYYCEEPRIEGTYEGVQYCTSWLGGALNFFIFKSPVQTDCQLCSPCVPGAGNLDEPGDWGNLCYGVPESWRKSC